MNDYPIYISYKCKPMSIKEMIRNAIFLASMPIPECECKDGGIPDMIFDFRNFCKCLRCGWHISKLRVVEMELKK